jgi:hypothetical protein
MIRLSIWDIIGPLLIGWLTFMGCLLIIGFTARLVAMCLMPGRFKFRGGVAVNILVTTVVGGLGGVVGVCLSDLVDLGDARGQNLLTLAIGVGAALLLFLGFGLLTKATMLIEESSARARPSASSTPTDHCERPTPAPELREKPNGQRTHR